MLSFHDDNNEDDEKQDIITNIDFEAIVPSMKNNFFYHIMVDFVNKVEFIDQEYQTDGTVRDESYKGKFLFPTKDCVLFGKDQP